MKLEIKSLTKNYDDKEVLKNINFTFESGKIYGLLGRNGSGKTTFFNCLNEDVDINSGEFYKFTNLKKKFIPELQKRVYGGVR